MNEKLLIPRWLIEACEIDFDSPQSVVCYKTDIPELYNGIDWNVIIIYTSSKAGSWIIICTGKRRKDGILKINDDYYGFEKLLDALVYARKINTEFAREWDRAFKNGGITMFDDHPFDDHPAEGKS